MLMGDHTSTWQGVPDSILSGTRQTLYKDTVGTEAPPGGPFASHRRAGFFPSIADPVIDAVVESVATRPSKWSKLTFYFATARDAESLPPRPHTVFARWASNAGFRRTGLNQRRPRNRL